MTDTLGVVYFPAAVALGALHALEPGHAKALTASYLIGIKGTKRDSVVLGLSVAATHSIVVIGISAIGLWVGNEAFTGHATEWLERGSGVVAITIGSWMLWRRLSLKYKSPDHGHHHAPNPAKISGKDLKGMLEIVDTPLGERMRFSTTQSVYEQDLIVEIDREQNQIEKLTLVQSPDESHIYISTTVPGEPHEFTARIISKNLNESVSFSMKEPEGHHDHSHMDDAAHAKAHAETLPSYVGSGQKPSVWQIIGFGAAGGMIPCPASITVMLLAVSTGKTALGVFTVLGFSLGLALALVGVGVLIVTGLSKLSNTGRLSWISRQAPIVSASLVIVSGLFALLIAH